MLNLFKSFMKEEEGNVVEYIIVLAVVSVIIAFAFPTLRSKLQDWFTNTMDKITAGLGF